MCFIKKSSLGAQAVDAKVERHQADAELTKNSLSDNSPQGYLQNLKTTPIGLADNPKTDKKTLLGE